MVGTRLVSRTQPRVNTAEKSSKGSAKSSLFSKCQRLSSVLSAGRSTTRYRSDQGTLIMTHSSRLNSTTSYRNAGVALIRRYLTPPLFSLSLQIFVRPISGTQQCRVILAIQLRLQTTFHLEISIFRTPNPCSAVPPSKLDPLYASHRPAQSPGPLHPMIRVLLLNTTSLFQL